MSRRLPQLSALRAFEAAARHVSFTRAAEELSVTQGAVSHQVKALELELGIKFFNREQQRLSITEAGREYLAGDRFSAADLYVGAQLGWGMQFGTIPARDSLNAYAERVRARDAYQAGKAIDNALIAEMQAEQSPA